MKQYRPINKKQGGFVGIIFVAIALIAMVMAALAYMSRSSTSGVTDQGAKTNAAVILKQGSDFKSGYDRLLVSGTATPATITFNATGGTGLFDPAQGYAVLQTAPVAAQVVAQPYTYSKLVSLTGVGTGGPTNVLTLGNLTFAVCQQINKTLLNDTNVATTTGSLAQWTTAPAAITVGTVPIPAQSEGCVQSSDTKYVYYKTMVEL